MLEHVYIGALSRLVPQLCLFLVSVCRSTLRQVHTGIVWSGDARWATKEYMVLDFDSRFRLVRTVKRTSFEDRWKIT